MAHPMSNAKDGESSKIVSYITLSQLEDQWAALHNSACMNWLLLITVWYYALYTTSQYNALAECISCSRARLGVLSHFSQRDVHVQTNMTDCWIVSLTPGWTARRTVRGFIDLSFPVSEILHKIRTSSHRCLQSIWNTILASAYLKICCHSRAGPFMNSIARYISMKLLHNVCEFELPNLKSTLGKATEMG